MGSSNPCTKDPSKCTGGLTGLSAACETCIVMNCSMDFETCESTPGCVAGLNCIIPCFHKGGTLVECGSMCGPDASSALMNTVETAIVCAATSCGTTTTCNPSGVTKDSGAGG